MRTLLGLIGFALTLTIWWWVKDSEIGRVPNLIIMFGGVLVVLPVVWIGRLVLDARPTCAHAAWITTLVHYAIMIPLGAALIKAVSVGQVWPVWAIPLPAKVGLLLMVLSGAAVLLTVANLALRALGAPFAIALSRQLATDWLYAYTRNPMVLSLLAFLMSVGLWLRSALFTAWVAAVFMPVMLVFLKVYEERELEIRFGAPYLEYKAKTPTLWPRKPRQK